MNLKELLFGGGVQSGDSGGAYRDSIQAWLPIKNIIGGVVITKDNRFVKILEVLPVNIYLKSTNDRQNIINEINRILAELPPEHPAKGPHGLFLKARENLWGNIIIGLGNRLAIFQDPLVDKITRNHDVDLLLPGQKPCAYFVIISAQDSTYRFLSSLFFSLTFPRLSDYARLHGGRLPVLTNFCLEEYLNIGYMEGISDVFNSIRGFNMSVQLAVQSLSQWKEKYPGTEWENQLNAFDRTIYMGCNDLTSAKYFAEKCGKVTISVTNNQFPLMPLFSPVYSSTRPYSQTRSNTQRDLLQADEFLRLDRYKCVVMFNHYKPAHLYTPVLLLNSRKRNRITVQEPQILRVLPLRILLRQIKNRRIRSPRTTETAIQEPQILCLQNRRNRRQVRKKKEILI